MDKGISNKIDCSSSLSWTCKKKGKVTFNNPKKGEFEVTVPPEFMGHRDMITPEDLFLASVNSCLMSYFLNLCEQTRLKLVSYDAEATDCFTKNGIDFVFAKVMIDVTICVSSEKDAKKAKRAMNLAAKGCYVANSIKPDVEITHTINVVN